MCGRENGAIYCISAFLKMNGNPVRIMKDRIDRVGL